MGQHPSPVQTRPPNCFKRSQKHEIHNIPSLNGDQNYFPGIELSLSKYLLFMRHFTYNPRMQNTWFLNLNMKIAILIGNELYRRSYGVRKKARLFPTIVRLLLQVQKNAADKYQMLFIQPKLKIMVSERKRRERNTGSNG